MQRMSVSFVGKFAMVSCDMCGKRITEHWGTELMCGCGGKFCSDLCSGKWHNIEPSKRPKEGKGTK